MTESEQSRPLPSVDDLMRLVDRVRAIVWDDHQLNLVFALGDSSKSAATLAACCGLEVNDVVERLEPLVHAGLVEERGAPGDWYRLRDDRIAEALVLLRGHLP